MNDLVDVLNGAGFKTVVGADNVLQAIKDSARATTSGMLCSGYRVFPGGEKCPGCSDCMKETP
jgi:hypothetical protein